MMGGPAYT